MQIGKYVIEIPNDNSTKIHVRGTNKCYLVPVEKLISEYILHIDNLKTLFSRYDNETIDQLSEFPQIMEIIANMDEHDFIPGMALNEEQLKYFHHNQLLNGYNKLHKTSITMLEIGI